MVGKIAVLVVDDSPSVRATLIQGLSADPRIEVVGSAYDGVEAVEKVKALRPDVVTLDVEMPRMDGVRALELIMAERPTPVVMVSSLTRRGAEVTVRALELGAVDFVLKTGARGSSSVSDLIAELQLKIRQAAAANVTGPMPASAQPAQRSAGARPAGKGGSWNKRVVVIASSTGGPQALRIVIPSLPSNLPAPVLVVQHLPPNFTAYMASTLDMSSPLKVEEARPGEKLSPGRVLVAPGGVQMTVTPAGSIHLGLGEPECGVRPSANPTMESVASVYGPSSLGVILTGMGSDGTRGAGLIKSAGGSVIAQDESTCLIYGMPRSAAEAGYVDKAVPLSRVASEIVRVCRSPVRLAEVAS